MHSDIWLYILDGVHAWLLLILAWQVWRLSAHLSVVRNEILTLSDELAFARIKNSKLSDPVAAVAGSNSSSIIKDGEA